MFTTGIENSYPNIILPDGRAKGWMRWRKRAITKIGRPIFNW